MSHAHILTRPECAIMQQFSIFIPVRQQRILAPHFTGSTFLENRLTVTFAQKIMKV